MTSWAFESLLARLPDDDHLVLEIGDSGLSFPREVGRVVIVRPGHDKTAEESSKIKYVEGDVAHVPTVLNAARYAVDLFGELPILLLSVGTLDALDPSDASELCELLLAKPGPCVGAILKTSHNPTWRFSGDPRAGGLVSMIRDYRPQTQSHETWWLYVRQDGERNEQEGQ